MKKNGFITMSLVYAFFLLFVALMVGILVNMAHNRVTQTKINEEIKDTLENLHKLTIILDGGTLTNYVPEQIRTGNTQTINNPVKDGYSFMGWTKSENNSTLVGTTFTMGSDNTVLTAKWIKTDFSFSGNYELITIGYTGWYKMELWGAQGGNASINNGGGGGYTSGYINLTEGDKLYLYVGGQGGSECGGAYTEGTCGGGYNGGGKTGYWTGFGDVNKLWTGGGGGATDIRYFGDAEITDTELLWNSTLGLNSRIMVAGGGGGATYHNSSDGNFYYGDGGGGGNLIGKVGDRGSWGNYAPGYGGTQAAVGTSNWANCTAGGFGYGAYASAATYYCPGGGGGYYGGGGSVHSGSGGGSSYISGYAGVNSITSASSRTATNTVKHYSEKYFINGEMKSGVNIGDGKAKLTYLSSTKPLKTTTNLNNVQYIKDCATRNNLNGYVYWGELQAIKDGINIAKGKTVTGTVAQYNADNPYTRIVDGNSNTSIHTLTSTADFSLRCITVNLGSPYDLDEVAVWHLSESPYFVYSHYNNTLSVSTDSVNWTTIIPPSTEYESSEGKRVNAYTISNNTTDFTYTGDYQIFTTPSNGYYQIEAWGAQGGAGSSAEYPGGDGAYTKGKIYLEQGEKLYVYVGGKGSSYCYNTVSDCSGGYNGGGNTGYYTGYIVYTGSGGGATDIRYFRNTTPSHAELVWNSDLGLNNRIMVAAGGGAGTYYSSYSYSGSGTGGGGLSSEDGRRRMDRAIAGKATQTAPGTIGWVNGCTIGDFGYGAYAKAATNYCAAGGGGYYGGGGTVHASSTGGSSYISGHTGCVAITDFDNRTVKSGCTEGTIDNSCSIHYSTKAFTDTIMIDGNGYAWTNTKGSVRLMPNPKGNYYDVGTGNINNGYVRITSLGNS